MEKSTKFIRFLIKRIVFSLLSVFILGSCNKGESEINHHHQPVADAGIGITVVLPVASVMLDGNASNDPDDNITTYEWLQQFGPSFASIATPNEPTTQITGLIEGIYRFELQVTDASGLTSNDFIEINVLLPTGTSELIFNNQVLNNQCYDDRPGVCWINSDSPSYGFFIKNEANSLPDPAITILGVSIRMDTSAVWEQVPANCWSYEAPYPQSNFTYCRSTEGLSVSSWFLSMENLAGRKADIKIVY